MCVSESSGESQIHKDLGVDLLVECRCHSVLFTINQAAKKKEEESKALLLAKLLATHVVLSDAVWSFVCVCVLEYRSKAGDKRRSAADEEIGNRKGRGERGGCYSPGTAVRLDRPM